MFKETDIKVSVISKDALAGCDIVIWRPVDNEKVLVYRTREGVFTWEEDFIGNEIRPSLSLPGVMVKPVLQKLVNEIKDQTGVKASADKVYESELGAVKDHLEDMRKLIFKSNWIEIQNGSPAIVVKEG